MKLKRQHAYIVVKVDTSDNMSGWRYIVDKEVMKNKFPNEKHKMIKTNMNVIVSFLLRKSSDFTQQNTIILIHIYFHQ